MGSEVINNQIQSYRLCCYTMAGLFILTGPWHPGARFPFLQNRLYLCSMASLTPLESHLFPSTWSPHFKVGFHYSVLGLCPQSPAQAPCSVPGESSPYSPFWTVVTNAVSRGHPSSFMLFLIYGWELRQSYCFLPEKTGMPEGPCFASCQLHRTPTPGEKDATSLCIFFPAFIAPGCCRVECYACTAVRLQATASLQHTRKTFQE